MSYPNNRMGNRRGARKSFVSGGVINCTPTPTALQSTQQNLTQDNSMQKQDPSRLQQRLTVAKPGPVKEDSQPANIQTTLAAPPPPPKIENQDQEMLDSTMNNGEQANDEDGRKFRRRYLDGIRKKPSVRAKEKRIRQNRRLRKVLIPKNALMALHEVKGIKIGEFVLNSRAGGGFTAEVSVNNIQYEGTGASKTAAKNVACEKALRDLIISKMLLKPKKEKVDKPDVTANNVNNTNDDIGESEDVDMKNVEDNSEEDDLPMINLASFALFKLFSEWQNEGFEVPEFRQSSQSLNIDGQLPLAQNMFKVDKPKKPPVMRTELPANWQSMHPAMLLCMMRPGITYIDLGTTGTPPNAVQRFGVTVDEEYFVGEGRSKKAARKHASLKVCNKLFGTNFQPEE